jgi:hypothetical protein
MVFLYGGESSSQGSWWTSLSPLLAGHPWVDEVLGPGGDDFRCIRIFLLKRFIILNGVRASRLQKCKEVLYIKSIIDDSKKYFCMGESPLPKGVGELRYRPSWQDIRRSRKSLGPVKMTSGAQRFFCWNALSFWMGLEHLQLKTVKNSLIWK